MKSIYDAVIAFDGDRVIEQVGLEIAQGREVAAILKEGLISPLDEVGRKFSRGELFLPEMLAAAQAMKAGLELIRPMLTEADAPSAGKVVIGTVKGDLHDIGKDLVAMMFEGAGFTVLNLGVDVAPETFVAAARENAPNIVALSALLTTTMPAMEATVKQLKAAGVEAKLLVGGAPVSQSFAERIGAHGYADDAPGAVALGRSLLSATGS
jgi:5-methyltetrahydrofolate--homocysteine methyltransferase